MGRRPSLRSRARLQLRRDHAVLRTIADAARHEPNRPPAHSRSRLLVPSDRSEGRGPSEPALYLRLAGARSVALAWSGARRWGRDQRTGDDAAVPRRGPTGFLSGGAPLHADGAGCSEGGVSLLSACSASASWWAASSTPGSPRRVRYRAPSTTTRTPRPKRWIGFAQDQGSVLGPRDALAAAALQFPLAHPIVASIIPGAFSPDQVRQNVDHCRHPIPASLWSDLKSQGLIAARRAHAAMMARQPIFDQLDH